MKTALIGRQLGDYTLTRLLATGGMSRIYEGVDRRLDRRAAVKVLDLETELAEAESMAMRFQREARALARMEHPNIIPIYQFGEDDGLFFIAMKLIDGSDLAQELKELRKLGVHMEPARALPILEQVASALDAAHAEQIIHRDIKPSNILIDLSDKATLTDFGLVIQPSVDSTYGTAFGTPRYISPEQATDSSLAVPQSDIYSLGVITYEILTGKTPFDGKSPMEIAISHINDAPPPPRSVNALIPLEVERAVLKSLAKEPERRYAAAGEFIAAVRKGYRDAGIVADDTTGLPRTVAMPNAEALRRASQEVKTGKRSPAFWAALAIIPIVVIAAAIIALSVANSQNDVPATLTMQTRVADNYVDNGFLPETMTADTIAISGTQTAIAEGILTSVAVVMADSNAQPPAVPTELFESASALRLVYSDTALTLINLSSGDVGVADLSLNRGADSFTGDRIPRGVLPAGACFRITLQGRQTDLPRECRSLHSEVSLRDADALFWRANGTDGDRFALSLGGQTIAVCDASPRGETMTCAAQVESS